ncbi:MAG TPA: NAD(P)H-dependent oxidoreductase subunit E [Ignavibacteria bacterium]|nr:NAD(P)H-dependent oxidoreductase subunit E [Ignavibacteria bacterium]
MTNSEKKLRNEFISKLEDKYGNERPALLPILQEIQKEFLYIDEHSQQVVAEILNIHPVEVQSVISFYAFLYDKPQGRNQIRFCKNIICEFNGSREIADAVKSELGIEYNETSVDGKATLELVNCFGLCDKSPSMMINSHIYENINKESAINLIRNLK